ncbi:MAG TPA: hypothetical protein VEG64_17400 [Candidatus Sulfotelmatobacter sp.]|nr:hypothetical protein [Candidatus Sulfotelmatobacter sp.]
MSTETNRPQNPPEDSYERTDAHIGALLQFAFWLAVVIIASALGMKWMFSYFARVQKLGPPASPFENVRVLPPNPKLQVEPRAELEGYREADRELLATYGWVDKHNGVVRIPIDRAMDLVLQRGLPARPAEGAAPAKSPDSRGTTETALAPAPDSRPAIGPEKASQP